MNNTRTESTQHTRSGGNSNENQDAKPQNVAHALDQADVSNDEKGPEDKRYQPDKSLQEHLNDFSIMPLGGPGLAQCLDTVSVLYLRKFKETQVIDDLRGGLRCAQAVVEMTPSGHPLSRERQEKLVAAYLDMYRKVWDTGFLLAALKCGTLSQHSGPLGNHQDLAASYLTMYKDTGDFGHLFSALKHRHAFVDAASAHDPGLPVYQQDLAMCYREMYHKTGDLGCLKSMLTYGHISILGTSAGDPGLPELHSSQVKSYGILYHSTGNIEYLKSAVKHSHTAVVATPVGHPKTPQYQTDLAELHRKLYQKTGDMWHFMDSLRFYDAAINATPTGYPVDPGLLHGLALLYHEKYKGTKRIKDLNASLKYGYAAVSHTPLGDQMLSYYLKHLATNHAAKFERDGQTQDLGAAVKFAIGSVEALPTDHLEYTRRQLELGILYQKQKYGRQKKPGPQQGFPEWYIVKYAEPEWLDYDVGTFGEKDDEEEYEIEYEAQDEAEGMAVDKAYVLETPKHYDGLVSSYWHIHERAEGIQDLEITLRQGHLALDTAPLVYPEESIQDQDTALRFNQASVDGALADHPELLKHQSNLSVSYIRRYARLGNKDDLSQALKYGHAALNAMAADHPLFIQTQLNLTRIYKVKYIATGGIEALVAAINLAETNNVLTPMDHSCISELAACHRLKYTISGNSQDLVTLFTQSKSTVIGTPIGHPMLSYYFYDLALSHISQHSITGETNSLIPALKYGHAAIDAAFWGDPRIPYYQLELSKCYIEKYKVTGDMTHLETALTYGNLAKGAIPQKHPELPKFCEQLVNSYETKYRRTGDIKDLYNAVIHAKAALLGTPAGHPNVPRYLYMVGTLYHSNFQRDRNFDVWETAINCCHAAVEQTPVGHPNLPEYQYGLALAHADIYRDNSRIKYLETALKFFQLATKGVPIGHPNLPRYQQGLARSHQARYRRYESLQDLETAQRYFQEAIQGTPKGHYTLPSLQHDLALCYRYKYKQNKDHQNLEIALDLYGSALQSTTASPQLLWDVGIQSIKTAEGLRSERILEFCSSVLNILPSLLWLGSSINIRHETLIRQDVPNFISIAVAIALRSSQLQVAIEFFEQGLSTTHRQIQQLNRKYDSLENQLPAKAMRLRDLSTLLRESSHEPHSLNYHVLAQDRKNLIDEIRTYPRFSDFLLPLKYSKLCMAAKNGPVILLHVADKETNVIIMLSPNSPPLHFPLPGISHVVAQTKERILTNALKKLRYLDANSSKSEINTIQHAFHNVRRWLWDMVVKPIFKVLQENGLLSGRLWWCPSGPFTNLPLHAAAPIKNEFIQSYTPTLDALIHANSRWTYPDANEKFTAVGVYSSKVPGWENPLFSVEGELGIVSTCLQNQAQQLKNEQASLDNVVHALQSSAWFHFSCHGEQDPKNPLESGLILYDKKLELGQILGIDLPNAKLAFLSACETATGDGKLPNEAMHLAGGFIAAGFHATIGTWWPIVDQDGPTVAKIVYQTILGKEEVLDVRRAAEGLHLATRKLREDRVWPSRWMPFVHMGV